MNFNAAFPLGAHFTLDGSDRTRTSDQYNIPTLKEWDHLVLLSSIFRQLSTRHQFWLNLNEELRSFFSSDSHVTL